MEGEPGSQFAEGADVTLGVAISSPSIERAEAWRGGAQQRLQITW